MHKLFGERTATHLMRRSSQVLTFQVRPLRYLPIIFPSVKDLLTVLYTADLPSHVYLRIARFECSPCNRVAMSGLFVSMAGDSFSILTFVNSTICPPKIPWIVETEINLVPTDFTCHVPSHEQITDTHAM